MAIVNSAAVNIEMCVSFQIVVFSRYMLRSGIAGSYDNSRFSFPVFKKLINFCFFFGCTGSLLLSMGFL